MAEHKVKLAYTTDDDGVWVLCSCGWGENLGFEATPEDAMKAQGKHVNELMVSYRNFAASALNKRS